MATGGVPPRRYRVATAIDVTPAAARARDALPADVRRRIGAKIDALADEPRPPRVRKLAGMRDTYRVRVGDYRVIYEIHDDVLLVLVIDVGHRRDVYRD